LYKQEELLLRVVVQANRLREQLGITRTELARRLGTSKGNVTQILRGETLTQALIEAYAQLR
jgi:transcriptional regulator with XRE-family HTH domain